MLYYHLPYVPRPRRVTGCALRAATCTSPLPPSSYAQDEDRTVQSEVRELFQRRKDKLRERRTYPQKVVP